MNNQEVATAYLRERKDGGFQQRRRTIVYAAEKRLWVVTMDELNELGRLLQLPATSRSAAGVEGGGQDDVFRIWHASYAHALKPICLNCGRDDIAAFVETSYTASVSSITDSNELELSSITSKPTVKISAFKCNECGADFDPRETGLDCTLT